MYHQIPRTNVGDNAFNFGTGRVNVQQNEAGMRQNNLNSDSYNNESKKEFEQKCDPSRLKKLRRHCS